MVCCYVATARVYFFISFVCLFVFHFNLNDVLDKSYFDSLFVVIDLELTEIKSQNERMD